MGLGFFIDTTSCSGCKTCQVACKDAHDLDDVRLWRSVATVEGGAWTRCGAAWTTTAFAYSVSLSCMHCEKPACVAACPTGAIRKQDDGVVAIAEARCIGCRYCEWTCPYGAPRFDEAAKRMTKCDFCADERAGGRAPICVAACPMRALDFGELAELERRYGTVRDLYPLPDSRDTRPSVVIRRRTASDATPRIANREEL